jgi:hypothetical protein
VPNYVQRESDNTSSRYVNLTFTEQDGRQVVMGSDRALPILDISHQRLHEGRAFLAYKFYSSTDTLANGATASIAIACAEGCEMHMLVQAECGGSAEFYWYEGAAVTEGTPFTAINRKRASTNTSDTAILINPTVSNAGTLLLARSIPGGSGVFAGGGSDYSFEYVLKDLTTYLFELKNTSGSARAAHLLLEWYE